MATVDQLLAEAHEELAGTATPPPRREINLLLSKILGWSEASVMSRGESPVSPPAAERFRALLGRRLTGEPLAYLTGEREFFGRCFLVDARVLIPRPETEHLVETALDLAPPGPLRILDIGTGSGCLGITLACEIRDATIVAVDCSLGALAIAGRNNVRHRTGDRMVVVGSDLVGAIDLAGFDLVVSNPPYVDPGDRPQVSPEVADFEPRAAVFAPGSGTSIIRRLLAELAGLAPGTPFCFEIGAGQAHQIERLVAPSAFDLLEIRPDLAGIPRVAACRRK